MAQHKQIKKCVVCGREFQPVRGNRQTCSENCYQYYVKYVRQPERYYAKTLWYQNLEEYMLQDFISESNDYWFVNRLRRFYESFKNAWDMSKPQRLFQRIKAETLKKNALEGVYNLLRLEKVQDIELIESVLLKFALSVFKEEEKAKEEVQELLKKKKRN